MKIDKSIIKELTDYLNEFNLTEIEYTEKDTKIKVSKSTSSIPTQSIITPNPTAQGKVVAEAFSKAMSSGTAVTSPIIGTAYHSPEPGAKKFSEIGKRIKKGETVMIVEAMKTMNHVPSTADGIIKEICIEDGQPVEYGQTIIIVE
jgi:acetyl-CoA carboxylase biotin carboxyl carrier protein